VDAPLVVGDLTAVFFGWWADVFSQRSDHRFSRPVGGQTPTPTELAEILRNQVSISFVIVIFDVLHRITRIK